MRILLKILVTLACIWAIYLPSTYAVLFAVFKNISVLVDLTAVISCIVLAAIVFIKPKLVVSVTSLTIVLAFSSAGLFHQFQDSGASGPLPYEWINDYYIHSIPLLIIVSLNWFVMFRQGKLQASK